MYLLMRERDDRLLSRETNKNFAQGGGDKNKNKNTKHKHREAAARERDRWI